MKIIIDIPKDFYNQTIEHDRLCWEYMGMNEMVKAIKNGTPLPEKHGRLIDADETLKSLTYYLFGDKTIGQCIDDAPTILEASEVTE